MSLLIPGQTSDCTNPVLDVFMHDGQNNLLDINMLEFQILDPSSMQVHPPSGRQAVDVVNLCPTGGKISTGHYVAEWTVPDAAVLGTYTIKWYFKFTASSPEQSFCEDFEVDAVQASSSASAADIFNFKARFPLLADKGDELIGLVIEEAKRCVNVACFGDKSNDAIYLLAAHLLEMTTNAGIASGLQTVTAGMASIQFKANSLDPQGLDKTSYGQLYQRLLFLAGPAATVLC